MDLGHALLLAASAECPRWLCHRIPLNRVLGSPGDPVWEQTFNAVLAYLDGSLGSSLVYVYYETTRQLEQT